MQAVLDYEKSQKIPIGWINYSISNSGRNGAWQRLERGEIPLDAVFFRDFNADLRDPKRWKEFHAKQQQQQKDSDVPALPDIDAEWLYWEMMSKSRAVDPNMYPALKRLREAADRSGGRLILGALSNTSIFPRGHPFNDDSTPEGRQNKQLKGMFDIFVSSAHVGMRKPDGDIYKYAITRLHEYVKLNDLGAGVRPQDITFLDDIGGNLRTARKLGMNTVSFSTELAFESFLHRYLN